MQGRWLLTPAALRPTSGLRVGFARRSAWAARNVTGVRNGVRLGRTARSLRRAVSDSKCVRKGNLEMTKEKVERTLRSEDDILTQAPFVAILGEQTITEAIIYLTNQVAGPDTALSGASHA